MAPEVPLYKEEAVERYVFGSRSRQPLLGRHPHCRNQHETHAAREQRHPEYRIVIVRGFEQIERDGGPHGHGQVAAHAEIADAFAPSRRGHHVDGHRAVGHTHYAVGKAVQRPYHGKKQYRCRQQITAEDAGKHGITDEHQPFAGESIDHETGKGTHEKRRYGVERQDHAHGRLIGFEALHQIEGQHGQEQVKGKEEKKTAP